MKIQKLAMIALTLAASSGQAAPPAAAGTQVLISFKDGKKAEVRQAILAAGGQISYVNDDVQAFAVSVASEAALDTLAESLDIGYIEEDPIRTVDGAGGDRFDWGVETVQARDVWDADRDGKFDTGAPRGNGRTVCIIDTGVRVDHPDLAGVDITGGVSLVEDGPWYQDNHGHGTHIAGIIAAQRNGFGTIGIAPKASIYVVRAASDSGQMSTSTLIRAVEACVAGGADVINMSLGGPIASRTEHRFYKRLYNRKNVLLIAAAGNDGSDQHHFPASYDAVVSVGAVNASLEHSWFSQANVEVELTAPGEQIFAAFPRQDTRTLSVDGGTSVEGLEIGGLFARGEISGRLEWGGDCREPGNFNGAIAICNFGDFFGTDQTIHNMIASGASGLILLTTSAGGGYYNDIDYPIVTLALDRASGKQLVHGALTRSASLVSTRSDEPGYRLWQGTSFSTPHVAGVAALIWSAHKTKPASAVRQALTSTARDLGDPGRDPYYGFGLIQAKAALQALSGL